MKFKLYDQSQIMLLPPDIQDMVPSNHVVRAINLVVEQLDMNKLYDSYSEEGQPGYHPKMLLKILLYGYSIGIRSSRKLAQRTESDIYFMFLSAMQRPDFRTISDFRKLKGEYLQEYFIQILDICKEMGMVSLGHISIDGSKIKSNSSKHSLKSREALDEYEKDLRKKVKVIFDNAESTDRTEDEEHGTSKRGDELPEDLSDENKLLEKILEAKKEIKEKNLKRVSVTDKDSRLMLMSNGGYDMSYNAQISVDSHKQIILSCDVVNDSNDYGQFERMYEQVITNTNQKPEEVSVDAGYSSGKTLNYIKQNQIDAYIPDGRMNNEVNEHLGEERIKKYDRRNFKYDPDSDRYICPEGKSMLFEQNSKRNGVKYKIYRGTACRS